MSQHPCSVAFTLTSLFIKTDNIQHLLLYTHINHNHLKCKADLETAEEGKKWNKGKENGSITLFIGYGAEKTEFGSWI